MITSDSSSQQQINTFINDVVLHKFSNTTAYSDSLLKEIIRSLGRAGLLKKSFPKDCGGDGKNIDYTVALHWHLSQCDYPIVSFITLSHLDIAARLLSTNIQSAIIQEIVTKAITGEFILALALTEEASGSDLKSIETTAYRKDAHWLINGKKKYITNATIADGFCVLAKTSNQGKFNDYTLFFVPKNIQGVSVTKLHPIGNKCLGTITFDNAQIPTEYVLGAVGSGLLMTMKNLDFERILISVRMISMMEYFFKKTVIFTRERKTFGKSLLNNQAIQFKLSEIKTEIESKKALLRYAIYKFKNNKGNKPVWGTVAKYSAGTYIDDLADSLLQFWGKAGYHTEHPIGRFYQDAPGLTLAAGTTEILCDQIATFLEEIL